MTGKMPWSTMRGRADRTRAMADWPTQNVTLVVRAVLRGEYWY